MSKAGNWVDDIKNIAGNWTKKGYAKDVPCLLLKNLRQDLRICKVSCSLIMAVIVHARAF